MIKCIFENNSPALLRHVTVDSIVIKDNQILLIKRAAHLSNPGKYALPGGFLNRDETTAAAALRELQEETGYTGKVLSLLRICDNPNRINEDRQNVGFIYIVEPLKKVTESDDEVQEVKWFALDSLPPFEEFAFDHYSHVELYLKFLKEKFAIPVVG